jgi:hypothetical protein
MSRSIPTSAPKRPVLFAVDQEFAEGPGLGVPPVRADRIGAVEVGEHQDVEQLGAGSGTEGVEALTERRSIWSRSTGSSSTGYRRPPPGGRATGPACWGR